MPTVRETVMNQTSPGFHDSSREKIGWVFSGLCASAPRRDTLFQNRDGYMVTVSADLGISIRSKTESMSVWEMK